MKTDFYAKYGNLHMTNNLDCINPYELKENDSINVLNYNNDIVKQNTIHFINITNNNIINFYIEKQEYNSFYTNKTCKEKLTCYYDKNKYISIQEKQSGFYSKFREYIINISNNNTNKKYIYGKYNFEGNEYHDEENYSYLLFPTEGDYIKILINVNLLPDNDLLIYFNPMGNMGYYDVITYSIQAEQILDLLDEDENIKWFKYLIFNKNYKTKQYIADSNRKKTLKTVNSFLEKHFNVSFKPQLCFENKKNNLKSYIENNQVIISHNDKIINFDEGSKKDKFYYHYWDDNKYKLISKPIEFYSNNKVFQNWYRIAYAIAKFKINNTGINPETGEYYHNGEIITDRIIYKDYKYIIVHKNYDKGYYEKINKYFVLTEEDDTIKTINENYEVYSRLIE